MKAHYDAIVIGSGFGGSVAACRLAQANFSVAVLERGRRYDEKQNFFPRNWDNPTKGWLWQFGQGLFDVRHFAQMMVVQAAGLGGGSLVYANVHLRAPQAVFDQGWPAGYSRVALDNYYDLVAYMLDLNAITASRHFTAAYPASNGLPPKTAMMQQVAGAMNRSAQFCLPNIAVDFGPPKVPHLNKFGATQAGCNYCGECDIGCTIHAKNTLDFNYLKIAEDKGAEVSTLCEATQIEPAASGYRVTFTDHNRGGQVATAEAKCVFVCAGAVTSTELLLRCRDQYHTLPRLSPQLGSRYSGNGDFLAFAFNTGKPFMPSVGPTITTGIVYSRKDGNSDNWFIFEEGGYPKEIGGLLQVLNPKNGFLKDVGTISKAELENLLRRTGVLARTHPEAEHSAVFLAMGRDHADGRISLGPLHGLEIEWNNQSNGPLYEAEEQFARAVAKQMSGEAAFNPFWRLLRLPVTVHSLGGCPLGDTVERGVANADGEVFNYPGLFVLDGAALPVAIGANPSHTIAAVAERNIEVAIRRYRNDPLWRAPETALAKRIDDPLSDVVVPVSGTAPLAE